MEASVMDNLTGGCFGMWTMGAVGVLALIVGVLLALALAKHIVAH
jgi:hypothetical protein